MGFLLFEFFLSTSLRWLEVCARIESFIFQLITQSFFPFFQTKLPSNTNIVFLGDTVSMHVILDQFFTNITNVCESNDIVLECRSKTVVGAEERKITINGFLTDCLREIR